MHKIDPVTRYTDPYDFARLTAKEVEALDPFDSLFMSVLQAIPVATTYFISDLERRPELISYAIYRTTDLWWPLMLYNGIIDHLDMKSGIQLNCFRRLDIENLLSQLVTAATMPVGARLYNRQLSASRQSILAAII